MDNPEYSRVVSAWIALGRRQAQLRIVEGRLGAAERALAALRPTTTAEGSTIIDDWPAWQAVIDSVVLEAEISLMMSAAALNTLAEACAETWRIERSRGWGLWRLCDHLRGQREGDPGGELVALLPRLNGAYLRVVAPRNILAAHPLSGRGGFMDGDWSPPVRFDAWLFIEEVYDANEAAEELRTRLPSVSAIEGTDRLDRGRLLDFVIHNAEALSAEETQLVNGYMQKYGCRVVPQDAIAESISLIADVTALSQPGL